MAAKESTVAVDNDVLIPAALELYKAFCVAGVRRGMDDEVLATECFRKARAFAAVAGRIRAGEPIDAVVPEDDGLDYASAPNLKYGTDEWFKFNKGTKRFGKDGMKDVARQLVSSHN